MELGIYFAVGKSGQRQVRDGKKPKVLEKLTGRRRLQLLVEPTGRIISLQLTPADGYPVFVRKQDK